MDGLGFEERGKPESIVVGAEIFQVKQGGKHTPDIASRFPDDAQNRHFPGGCRSARTCVQPPLAARLPVCRLGWPGVVVMRRTLIWAIVLLALAPWGATWAQDDLNVCHVSSSYDVTLSKDAMVFDRADPRPRRVVIRGGHLSADGKAVPLDAVDQGRMAAFARTAMALVPKVRAIAMRGVNLAAAAVREQARTTIPQLAASGELDARLDAIAADLKQRIRHSDSTHDWHGPAFQQYVNQHVMKIVPFLAGELLQQAVEVALTGDLQRAARLRDRAATLAASLGDRVRAKLGTLKPDIHALCPSVRRLDELENGLDARLPDGSRLNLLTVGHD
jgi:polyhydroxyalkanoate synthesis regulator phasin